MTFSHLRWRRVFGAGALLAAAALLASACTASSGGSAGASDNPVVSRPASSGTSATTSSSPTSATPTKPPTSASPTVRARTVQVTSDINDGDVVGVGMPIVLNFSPAPTNSAAFSKAVTVTVNGKAANGAWYWEKPYADQPVQAHYREQAYWPANSTIQVKLPIGGKSAGTGLAYSGALTSVTFKTGDAHISTVNGATKQMVVKDNGKIVKQFGISLGQSETPTFDGTKLVMQKGEDYPGTNKLKPNGTVQMSNTAHTYNLAVAWSVRMTASGEYIHAAPWNSRIGQTNTSDGCTNLTTANAEWFYHFAQLGDVVTYTNTGGGQLNPENGLGDWNIPWGMWQQGGLLINHT